MDFIVYVCKLFVFLMQICSIVRCTDEKFFNLTEKSVKHLKYVENYQTLGELRDYCEMAKDCREYAYVCNRKLCECAEGYRIDDKNASCVGGVGARCYYDSHCIRNAFCRHQMLCFCKKEFLSLLDDEFNCKGEYDSKAARLTSPELIVYFIALQYALALLQ